MTYKSTLSERCLARFLTPANFQNTYEGEPTEPTKPPAQTPDFSQNLEEGTYKTYETCSVLPTGPDLTARWGPSLASDDPSIVIPRDWRSRVACLPHAEWVRWRSRSAEILAESSLVTGGLPVTADDVREADRMAAREMGIPGAEIEPE